MAATEAVAPPGGGARRRIPMHQPPGAAKRAKSRASVS